MKKIILTIVIGIAAFSISFSQKYAYVDTEYILDNIPEYKDAQNQLDDLVRQYKSEVEEKLTEIDRMNNAYQAEAVLMPDDIKEKKKEEIIAAENAVRELQNQRFGPDGDLFMKREELVKPIQEKIFNTIEEIATEKNYAFVFDKAGSLTILFVNPKYDISDDVLDEVGAVLGTVRKEDRVQKEYNSSGGNSSKSTNSPQSPGSNSRTVTDDRKK